MNNLDLFKDNEFIRLKRCNKHNLVSVNFTREAFFRKNWNDVTIKARGLFLDADSGEVRLRSFDKFFNIQEMNDNTLEEEFRNFIYPIRVSVKHNGFLGIVGVVNNEFVFSSKSSVDSDFALMFERIFNETISSSDKVHLFKFLKCNNCSAMFEVISPTEDPHIIEYDNEKVVLIGIVHNCLNTKPVIEFEKINEVFYRLSEGDTTKYYNSFDEVSCLISEMIYNDEVEGYVITDSTGYTVKLKGQHYLMIKGLRRYFNRWLRGDFKEVPNKETFSTSFEHNFLSWLIKLSPSECKFKSIIDAVKQFNNK